MWYNSGKYNISDMDSFLLYTVYVLFYCWRQLSVELLKWLMILTVFILFSKYQNKIRRIILQLEQFIKDVKENKEISSYRRAYLVSWKYSGNFH